MKHPPSVSSPSGRLAPVVALLTVAAVTACSTPPPEGVQAAGPIASHATSPATGPAQAVTAGGTFTGEVVETMNSGGYTYMRLQSGQEEIWAAANEFATEVGDSHTVSLDMPMGNFHSSTLDRTFDMVYFVMNVEGATPPETSTANTVMAAPVDPPPGGLSIADVWARRQELAGTTVSIRGTVVKVNNGILGHNWLHLQDGSGSATGGTHDLTVITDAEVIPGAIVTATGTITVGKDFGAGYAYEVILENARIEK